METATKAKLEIAMKIAPWLVVIGIVIAAFVVTKPSDVAETVKQEVSVVQIAVVELSNKIDDLESGQLKALQGQIELLENEKVDRISEKVKRLEAVDEVRKLKARVDALEAELAKIMETIE